MTLAYFSNLRNLRSIGVRLLFFEKNEGKKMKNDHNALIDIKMN